MSGYTPGPWQAMKHTDTKGWTVSSGNSVASVRPRRHDAETASNARLIAAAPDLLTALEGIVNDDSKHVPLADQRSRWNERMDAARAAIAKARAT